MDRTELAHALGRAAHLEGTFTLRSGQTSSTYFDKFQFSSRPELLAPVADALAELLPPETEVLAGLQLGGVPLAAALALRTGLPAVYVRLERKAYGTQRISEGVPIAGRRIAVIEDVVTTGGQIAASTSDLRGEGAIVTHALAVVDREQGGHESLAAHDLEFRTVFVASELVGGVST